MINDDISSLHEDDPSAPTPVSLRQGVVEAWDPDTGENSIQIAGGTLVNLPTLTSESASLVADDVVALLAAGDHWLVLGKVTTPGDPGTVPSWVGDITALAPLTDLAAVTDGLTITGATNETSDPGGGPRVVINDPAYPGEIVLYTDDPGEVTPARIMPIVSGTSYLSIIGPTTVDNPTPASFDLGSATGSGSTFELQANLIRLFGEDTKIDGFGTEGVRIGDGSDYVRFVGQTVTDADLVDPVITETEIWHEVGDGTTGLGTTYAAGTPDAAYPLSFRKDSSGVVHIRGSVTIAGSPTTTIFTLPAGYRPSAVTPAYVFLVYTNPVGSLGRVVITPAGLVQVLRLIGTTTSFQIDCSFTTR